MCEKTCRKWIWFMLERIQALKEKKVAWPDEWSNLSDTAETFVLSVDGVHFKCFEPKHPKYPKNKKMYSHKFNQAGIGYEIALSIFTNNVVWVNGPFPGSVHDKTIFNEHGLRQKMPAHSRGIADGGYRKCRDKLSTPNSLDCEEVRRFKGRARARQESFNSRIKTFKCMSECYRHDLSKHKVCFDAVVVICQYQMENGSPLFDV